MKRMYKITEEIGAGKKSCQGVKSDYKVFYFQEQERSLCQ